MSLGAEISGYEHEKMKLAGNFNCNVNQFKPFLLLWNFVKRHLISYSTNFSHINLKNQVFLYQVKIGFMHPIPSSYPDIFEPRLTKIWKLPNLSNIIIKFHFEPPFYTCSSHDRKDVSRFSWKNDQKMPFFHVFWDDHAKFFGFPLEYLDEWASFGKVIKFLNFWDIFQADITSGSG